jgi:hypothetical protein
MARFVSSAGILRRHQCSYQEVLHRKLNGPLEEYHLYYSHYFVVLCTRSCYFVVYLTTVFQLHMLLNVEKIAVDEWLLLIGKEV